MCVSTPKTEPAPAPPKVETLDATANTMATREADLRRRRQSLSKQQTQGAGAMQGSQAQQGKTKLGQ